MSPFYLAILTRVAFDNGFVVCYFFLTVSSGEVLVFQLTNEKSGNTALYIHDVICVGKKKKREICKVSGSYMLCGQIYVLNKYIVTLIV